MADRLTIHPDFAADEPFIRSLPTLMARGEGRLMHRGRNEIRCIEHGGRSYVVKSFRVPHLLNRLAYARIRASKAKRSYWHALELLQIGISTPQPIAYIEQVHHGLLGHSYYVCALSPCTHTYAEFLERTDQAYLPAVMKAVGELTARLHNHGYVLRDYSRGNILFDIKTDGTVRIEVVDLNRMTVHSHVTTLRGTANFSRLPATAEMHRLLVQSYADARHMDPATCQRLITAARRRECRRAKERY